MRKFFRRFCLEILFVGLTAVMVYMIPLLLRLIGCDGFLNQGDYHFYILPAFLFLNVIWYTVVCDRYLFPFLASGILFLGQGVGMYEYLFREPAVWMSSDLPFRDSLLMGVMITPYELMIAAIALGIGFLIGSAIRKLSGKKLQKQNGE